MAIGAAMGGGGGKYKVSSSASNEFTDRQAFGRSGPENTINFGSGGGWPDSVKTVAMIGGAVAAIYLVTKAVQ